MKPLCSILVTIAAVTAVGLASSCSCRREARNIEAAAELGQKHAAMLCDTVLTPHELHYRLLSVRAREWQMRTNGHDEAADEYIEAFTAYMNEHNTGLAAEL